MPIFQRQQRQALDNLVEEYSTRGMNRRLFLQRATAIGLSTGAASALLVACGGGSSLNENPNQNGDTPKESTTVKMLTVWGGEELASFEAVVEPFKTDKKITVDIESNRDANAILTTRIRANNPPDVAILPNPGKMQELARQNKLLRLDKFLDMSQTEAEYAKSWIDLGTYNDGFYALFYKAANKGTVWYNPKSLQGANLQAPKTWNELITLSDQIAGTGKYPWAMGVESGAASGWPAADWIAQLYLSEFGEDKYDQWVQHQLPWTDSSVKAAFEKFGKIVSGKNYINGAPQSILATAFGPATGQPFLNPPQAYMTYIGDFAPSFIKEANKEAQPKTDYDFFAFPTISDQYKGAITGGADVIVAFNDTTAVREFIKYLATAEAQTIWVKRGGFTSPNKEVSLDNYPDEVAKASAQMLVEASTFRYGAGDMMPSQVQNEFWKGLLTYIGDTSKLDSVLESIESVAQGAYTE